jgi:hypothetical protein
MTPSQKPEWIEIAEKDNSAYPRKVSKGLPVLALVVTASILGIGSIFAQSAAESPTNTVEMTAPAVQSSQSIEPSPATVSTQSAATQTSNTPRTTATSKISFTQQSSSAAVSSSAPTMINPSIGTLPTGGGDDDEDDDEGSEYEGDEYEGDDD